ncbi:hypothetical protein B0H19DRAFT_1245782 [Mycena capillaripes]|nr:hypothetical protein B0H19DRAFT_1245782 [Mycena capillaripes]
MSSSTASRKMDKPALTDEDKRRKHAEAQRTYRERNLEVTREKARERMGRYIPSQVLFSALVLNVYRLRASAKPLKRRRERKQRRSRDAEYREVRRKRKFIAEFGESAFHDYYLAHQRLLGVDEVPGISQQYRKDMANTPEAQKEKGGTYGIT